jgi:uncharacterized protein with HEPN domain
MPDDNNRIEAIIKYCVTIEEAMERFGNKLEDFKKDRHYQTSCSFCIDQIGENIKQIPADLTKEYKEIDRKGLKGMRDIISHGYHGIDLEEMWTTMTKEITPLKEACEKIRKELG